jgi:hypothetical protein
MRPGPLGRIPTVIIALHAAFAVLFLIVGLVASGGSDGWADLARVAVAALAGAWFVGASLTWLVGRFLIGNDIVRIVLAVVGPGLVVLAAILLIRAS